MTLRPTRRRGADGRWQEIQLELSHSCHELEEPPRDEFPQEFVHLDRPDLLREDSVLVTHKTVFQDVGSDFLPFRQ